MRKHVQFLLPLAAALALTGAPTSAQAVAGFENARPVQGDPGIFSMRVIEGEDFRVLRDYAEPDATRRMHNHDWAAYHTLTLITGRLRLQVQGDEPIEIGQGEVVSIPGGAMHTFTNIGDVTATIVEVFGKVEGS